MNCYRVEQQHAFKNVTKRTTAAPRKSRKSKSSAEELRGCDDAETRLLLEVRGTILLRRSPQVAAPCRTLCRVTSVCSAAVQRAESSVQSPRRFLSLSHPTIETTIARDRNRGSAR